MTPISDLTGFQRDSLWVLAAVQPATGTEFLKAIEAELHEDINQGRFYPNMDSLVEAGLIVKHENVPDNRTNTYELADAGRDLLKQRRQWEASQMAELPQVTAD